jgi:hypothetical protein
VWVCKQCGKVSHDLKSPVIGNWSRTWHCQGTCEHGKKKLQIKRKDLYDLAHSSHHVHCSTCRDMLLRRTLYDHAAVEQQQQVTQAAAAQGESVEKLQQTMGAVKLGAQAFSTGLSAGQAAAELGGVLETAGCSIM